MYCFSANHTALRRNSKDWFARNQVNVSEWGGISIRGLLFQWSSTIKIQLSMLVQYKADLTIISLKINLFLPWYSWKIVELALNNIHSIIRFHTLIPTGLVCLLTDNWLQCFILQRKINWKTCSTPIILFLCIFTIPLHYGSVSKIESHIFLIDFNIMLYQQYLNISGLKKNHVMV
jgi:hypothetical protein